MKKLSLGEETLMQHIRADKLPEPEREYEFHPERKWRFDFAWPELRIAVEVDGMHPSGRHNTPQGIANDNDKRNEAQIMGWLVLAFTAKQVTSGQGIDTLTKILEQKMALESIRLFYEREREEKMARDAY